MFFPSEDEGEWGCHYLQTDAEGKPIIGGVGEEGNGRIPATVEFGKSQQEMEYIEVAVTNMYQQHIVDSAPRVSQRMQMDTTCRSSTAIEALNILRINYSGRLFKFGALSESNAHS